MAQPNQATPTVQVNIAGTSTTVNLRDWLNTRLSPFLKKAIIESFDAEAEYPLQWLGEHLIQQSILFEGNPDTTNIQERFRYKHEAKLPAVIAQSAGPAQSSPTPQPAAAASTDEAVDHTLTGTEVLSAQTQVSETMETPTTTDTAIEGQKSVANTATKVNGSTEGASTQGQDTEMSNAP